MLGGWIKTGCRLTVIVSDLLSAAMPSLTATVATKVPEPAQSNAGARWMFPVAVPVPGLVVVTVMNAGPATIANVSGSPSGSLAVKVWTAVEPSFTVIFAGWERLGPEGCAMFTVIVNDLGSLLRSPSLTRTVAE